jgi:hypothetical protein
MCFQTSVENEDAIAEIVETVKNAQNTLAQSINSALDPSLETSSEGKQRIEELLK